MDKELRRIIVDYQATVRCAVILMYRSGIKMPHSAFEWIQTDIPSRGILNDGVPYYKHGAGCKVLFKTSPVDFDFGEKGEIDGFDLWRLTQFAADGCIDYELKTSDAIEQVFNAAAVSGEFIQLDRGLYYLARGTRQLALDIDSRLPGDKLPSANADQVLTLYTHYFLAADLMLKNYQKLDRKWDKFGKLSRNDEVQIRIYFFSWLGYLGVICEAFTKSLNVRNILMNDRPDRFKEILPLSNELGKIIKSHSDSIRKFRNSVFHLRENSAEIRNFFDRDANRLAWANDLHKSFNKFFSHYRVSCEVHYALNNRKGELDIRRY